jgi:membrane protein YdbS with pleckstrin-like domain
MTAKFIRLTHKIAIQLHLVTAVPFAVLAPGGQSRNFWIHSSQDIPVATNMAIHSGLIPVVLYWNCDYPPQMKEGNIRKMKLR